MQGGLQTTLTIEFDSAAEKMLAGVTDTRTRIAVLSHAMALMHAK
jgi:hypothetical protein